MGLVDVCGSARRRHWAWVLVAVPVVLAGWMLVHLSGLRGLERIEGGRHGSARALPPDSVVLDASAVEACTPPFSVRAVTASGGGGKAVLEIPQGGGSTGGSGSAAFAASVPVAGRYGVWARVLWRDSCGNSVALKLNEAPVYTVGQDAVYGVWHWVGAGQHDLPAGPCRLLLTEREDGIAVDQLLLTPDPGFVPTGRLEAAREGAGVRRFADYFARSPGHGSEQWQFAGGRWEIAFSLDPNRIPNQYSLTGAAADGPAIAFVRGEAWRGCRVSFSFNPESETVSGVFVDGVAPGSEALRIGFNVTREKTDLVLEGVSRGGPVALGRQIRPGQWHRLTVERWAWVLRVLVDDVPVFTDLDLGPAGGSVGFFVLRGRAAFDDMLIEELPWQAEDGARCRLPWQVPGETAWYRRPGSVNTYMLGRAGAVRAAFGGLNLAGLLLEEAEDSDCTVSAPGLVEMHAGGRGRLLVPQGCERSGSIGSAVTLSAGRRAARLRRVAVAYGEPLPRVFCIGPYSFADATIPDPSDYLDFTPEEYRRIRNSPEAQKLERRAKTMPVVAASGSSGVWQRESGLWRVADGVLQGRGPAAALRFWQVLACDLDLRMRVRLRDAQAAAGVVLYDGSEAGLAVVLRSPSAAGGGDGPAAPGALALDLPADGEWHDVLIRGRHRALSGRVDDGAWRRQEVEYGYSGDVLLKVHRGTVEFDDVEFIVPRVAPHSRFYAFDQREPDWWRDGGQWLDHGGITCVLASNWISLQAAESEGMIWNKRAFGADLLVAFNVEENTEWRGWQETPSHIHHPYDNIRVSLAPEEDPDRGYRLEVNSRNRRQTVLYRNGVEVAAVTQDRSFPIRYRGGHAPYNPRRSRIKLVKQGRELRAILNGREVLRYTDPEPLAVSRVGIGGYATRANISHILVREFPAGS